MENRGQVCLEINTFGSVEEHKSALSSDRNASIRFCCFLDSGAGGAVSTGGVVTTGGASATPPCQNDLLHLPLLV